MKRCGKKNCGCGNAHLYKVIEALTVKVCTLEKMLTKRIECLERQTAEASSVVKCMNPDGAYSDCWNKNYEKFMASGCTDPLFMFFKAS